MFSGQSYLSEPSQFTLSQDHEFSIVVPARRQKSLGNAIGDCRCIADCRVVSFFVTLFPAPASARRSSPSFSSAPMYCWHPQLPVTQLRLKS